MTPGPELPIAIRRARAEEASRLSRLAIESKALWGYPPSFLEACREALTLRPSDLRNSGRACFVAEDDRELVGFCTLDHARDPPRLDALFVAPASVRRGVGRRLLDHARREATASGARRILIEADPHAWPFYRTLGARRIGHAESDSISGRLLPLLELVL